MKKLTFARLAIILPSLYLGLFLFLRLVASAGLGGIVTAIDKSGQIDAALLLALLFGGPITGIPALIIGVTTAILCNAENDKPARILALVGVALVVVSIVMSARWLVW
jgi:hypothetical protein